MSHDSRAYCQGLLEMSGRDYGLPSEAEWERAARVTDGRIFPWGNQWDVTDCNSEESGLGKTASVHAHPQGASPCGLLDMAGNVREWTRSVWGIDLKRQDYCYPYNPTDGRE